MATFYVNVYGGGLDVDGIDPDSILMVDQEGNVIGKLLVDFVLVDGEQDINGEKNFTVPQKHSWASGQGVVGLDNDKKQTLFGLLEKIVATPAGLHAPGEAGQVSVDGNDFYFCKEDYTLNGPNNWIKISSVDIDYISLFVGVPPNSASDGEQGQYAYDPNSSYVYLCIDTNTWVRFLVENSF